MNGDQSIQLQHSRFAPTVTPGQAKDMDAHGKLGLLFRAMEKLESCILLELKALHEGAWKMGKFMAFSQ